MRYIRICVLLFASALASTSAFAKSETLAERGKRMCEEAGVPLEDCNILPPGLRGEGPVAAAATPSPRPTNGPEPATFGTGKYGWCDDCTSVLAAAPVTPWSAFGGRKFDPINDNGGQFGSQGGAAPGGDPGDDGGGGDDGNGGGGDDGNGGGGDDGNGGGGDDGNGGGGDDGNGGGGGMGGGKGDGHGGKGGGGHGGKGGGGMK